MHPVDPPSEIKAHYPEYENITITSPPEVPEEECGDLNCIVGVQQGGIFDGGIVIRSYWKLEPAEIEALANGGTLEIAFFTTEIPPTSCVVYEGVKE